MYIYVQHCIFLFVSLVNIFYRFNDDQPIRLPSVPSENSPSSEIKSQKANKAEYTKGLVLYKFAYLVIIRGYRGINLSFEYL